MVHQEKFVEAVVTLRVPRWVARYVNIMAMQESANADDCASAILTAAVQKKYSELGLAHDARLSDLWEGMRNASAEA